MINIERVIKIGPRLLKLSQKTASFFGDSQCVTVFFSTHTSQELAAIISELI